MRVKNSSNVLWRRDVFHFANWVGFCLGPPVVPHHLYAARAIQSSLIDDFVRPSSRQGKDDSSEEEDSLTLSDRLELAELLGNEADY